MAENHVVMSRCGDDAADDEDDVDDGGRAATTNGDLDHEVMIQQFTPYTHQVAGHRPADGKVKFAMLHGRPGRVLKPLQDHDRGRTELAFYKTVFADEASQTLKYLRTFLPQFHGLLPVNGSMVSYLELSDLSYKFTEPCIVDIKIGIILYGPEKVAADADRIFRKYPLAKTIGYQIVGMKTYCPNLKTHMFHDKVHFRRTLNLDNILDGGVGLLVQCASRDAKIRIVGDVLVKLRSIKDWFLTQTELVFYSSSLLIMYEGLSTDRCRIHDIGEHPNSHQVLTSDVAPRVDVRMIDFAHVLPSRDVDENYLYGLNSLISHFETLLLSD